MRSEYAVTDGSGRTPDQLFQQFLPKRSYINNVTASTREWDECAWKAFTAARARRGINE
jgi:hypothetical protein